MVAMRLAGVVLCLGFCGCASTGVPSPASAPAATSPTVTQAAPPPTLAQVREEIRMSSPSAAASLDAYLISAGPGKDRRTALELGTFHHLSAEGRGRDVASARRLLTELLATEPKPQRRAEFTVIAGLVDELVRLEAEAEARAQHARAELDSMRRQIDHLQENVRARDELLKKVADVVVSIKPKP
jgi:hypothetical protein